ncbi:hypothetical protein D3C84_600200 [compost metagenome]
MRQVQISDKGTHKPGFAHPGGQGEAKGGELPLEVFKAWSLIGEDRLQAGQDRGKIPFVPKHFRRSFERQSQAGKRFRLRWS